MKRFYFLFIFFFLSLGNVCFSQTKAKAVKGITKKYPESFVISKPVFDELFNLKIKEVLSLKENQYLDKAQVMMNTKNGDMTFLKLKLSYFPKSNLMIQVNGSYTTQIFIMSDDKSVFYKGKIEKENIVLKKCAESEIVSE